MTREKTSLQSCLVQQGEAEAGEGGVGGERGEIQEELEVEGPCLAEEGDLQGRAD